MNIKLNSIEARILGVLIEKQISTPEYYPLTLNSLVNACNQKSNRDPVMNLFEESVEKSLGDLRKQRLVMQVMTQGSRVPKYENNIQVISDFSEKELGILCELLLRGPQTVGELRTRTTRLVEFPQVAAVEHTLQKLMTHENGPFVAKLPRRPGHKESRYAHLFFEIDQSEQIDPEDSMQTVGLQNDNSEKDRIEILEKKVCDLYEEFNKLKTQLSEIEKRVNN